MLCSAWCATNASHKKEPEREGKTRRTLRIRANVALTIHDFMLIFMILKFSVCCRGKTAKECCTLSGRVAGGGAHLCFHGKSVKKQNTEGVGLFVRWWLCGFCKHCLMLVATFFWKRVLHTFSFRRWVRGRCKASHPDSVRARAPLTLVG